MIYLERDSKGKDGIFGKLLHGGTQLAVTLEHAYPDAFTYTPKVPVGIFKCVRGLHQLAGMTHPFETFEITGIKGHKNILFHSGNYNLDSSGCALLGQNIAFMADGKTRMITHSQDTFARFMSHLQGVNEFELTVDNKYKD